VRLVHGACAAAALLAVLAGCAGEQPQRGPEVLPAQDLTCGSSAVVEAVLEGGGGYPGGAQAPPPLPADLDVVAVIWCSIEPIVPTAGSVPTGQPPMLMQEVTFADGIGPLLDALAEPSQVADPAEDVLCTADFESKPVIFAVDATGAWYRAYWPVNVCGKSLDGAKDRWAELTPTSVVDVAIS
jgi:hypothetical protein